MKTARFSQIVEKCGAPTVHLAWIAPERDAVLKKALKQNRVMTIHQTVRGTAKDFGTVGLMTTPGAQIAIFPRSLKAFAERRVVGINYSLFAGGSAKQASGASEVEAAVQEKRTKRKATAEKRKPRPLETLPMDEQPDSEPDDATAEPPRNVVEMKPAPLTWAEARVAVIGARRTLKRGNVDAAAERLKKLAEQMGRAGTEADGPSHSR